MEAVVEQLASSLRLPASLEQQQRVQQTLREAALAQQVSHWAQH